MAKLAATIVKQIKDAVKVFESKRSDFETDATNLQNRLLANADLKKLIHSLKWRAKDPTHLHDKLERKAQKLIAEGKAFDITADNLFDKIPDLAGVRLLHLHMRQMEYIHPLIMKVIADEGYVLSGDPEAKTWDPEYEGMFKTLKVKVERNESLYTSVHYVVKQNTTTRRLCELQVRTLAEEIWCKISHTINYPHETDSIACKEQLKVLARLVSGCSRLVDSIVVSYDDHKKKK
ncbi:MAG TPA: RelA/SpoT domain-containing protein [Gemmata sp.]|jgi:ppGpp synthetase/RelA/SpoT-type nucleotidyltranferase|nr:RelA/SpoT domain-containing protein [Gemmata sp.]